MHGKQLRFGFRGVFGGEEWVAEMFSNEEKTRWRTADQFFEIDRPAELESSIILGFTRMGLLHNVATLGSGKAPDHADGGVADWVEVHDFTDVSEENLKGVPARRFGFSLRVGGEDSGQATLWLDAETGLPLRREQTTVFPDGEMKVVEIYRDMAINASIVTESKAFKTEY